MLHEAGDGRYFYTGLRAEQMQSTPIYFEESLRGDSGIARASFNFTKTKLVPEAMAALRAFGHPCYKAVQALMDNPYGPSLLQSGIANPQFEIFVGFGGKFADTSGIPHAGQAMLGIDLTPEADEQVLCVLDVASYLFGFPKKSTPVVTGHIPFIEQTLTSVYRTHTGYSDMDLHIIRMRSQEEVFGGRN